MNKTSIYQQVALNLLPVIGYWFWGWSMFAIIYIYWVEAVIISFFVFLKIAMSRGPEDLTGETRPAWRRTLSGLKILLLRLGIMLFYWIFIFLFVGMGQGKYDSEMVIDNMKIMIFMHQGFNLAVLAFFLSQIIEFIGSFIMTDDYLNKPSGAYTLFFDARTIVIHIVIVLGTFAHQFLDKYATLDDRLPGLGFVLVMFFVKTIADIVLYAMGRKNKCLPGKAVRIFRGY